MNPIVPNRRAHVTTLLWRVCVPALLLTVGLLVLSAPGYAQEPAGTIPAPPMPEFTPPNIPLVEPDLTEAEIAELESGAAAGIETLATVGAESVAGIDTSTLTQKIYMPLLSNDNNIYRADRIGFGASPTYGVNYYPDFRRLNAGWYVNWGVRVTPARPAGIEFMQMVRVHQKIDTSKMFNSTVRCGVSVTADRHICPYVNPPQYEYHPSRTVIEAAARKNPGSTWLIGNEMERPDWFGGRQDEITPELYAVAYHDIRAIILAADPTAKIAIGGVIQFTPLRRQYLDKVWNKYKQLYGVDIPVDVWNVHNFIGQELCRTEKVSGRNEYRCYGMGVPAGTDTSADAPKYLNRDNLHISRVVFETQIRDFRAWMKGKGQQNKPLIVSEYGVLYETLCAQTDPAAKQACIAAWNKNGGYVDLENPKVIHDFMLWTFEFFALAKDCTLTTVDDCRLVQRWAWFSLEDVEWNFNNNGALFDHESRQITAAGSKYASFSLNNYKLLQFE